MGIRETLNENPAITTAATGGIVLIAVIFILVQLFGGGGSGGGSAPSQTFFTIDDGATYFADDISKRAPFDYKGKPAVKAYVFSCDGGKTKFVGYLEKYTEDAKKKLDAASAAAKSGQVPDMSLESVQMTGMLIKKPKTGDAGWLKQTDPKAGDVTNFKCPDGSTTNLEIVQP